MKTAIKSFWPLVHFSNKGQKLGMILENKVLQKNMWSKNNFNKKFSPKVSFLTEKKIRNFRMILDLENSRWKSDFGHFVAKVN